MSLRDLAKSEVHLEELEYNSPTAALLYHYIHSVERFKILYHFLKNSMVEGAPTKKTYRFLDSGNLESEIRGAFKLMGLSIEGGLLKHIVNMRNTLAHDISISLKRYSTTKKAKENLEELNKVTEEFYTRFNKKYEEALDEEKVKFKEKRGY